MTARVTLGAVPRKRPLSPAAPSLMTEESWDSRGRRNGRRQMPEYWIVGEERWDGTAFDEWRKSDGAVGWEGTTGDDR